MGRPGITREQVFEAADALAEEGIRPTMKLVRDRTNGSFSTIKPLLAEWKDARGGDGVRHVPEMPERVTNACHSLWAAAWNANQDLLQVERDGLAAAREELERDSAELGQEIADLEGRLEATLAERDAIAGKRDQEEAARRTAEQEVMTLRVENARLSERVDNTEQRANELRAQVERLEGELARLAGEQQTKQQSAPLRRKTQPKAGT